MDNVCFKGLILQKESGLAQIFLNEIDSAWFDVVI